MAKPHGIAYLNMPGYQGQSWNPVTGCTPVGAGCENCWAQSMAKRYGWPTEPTFHSERLNESARWQKRRCVAVGFMGDLFHEDITDTRIGMIWRSMWNSSQHRYLVLTKRPERMADYLSSHPVYSSFRESFGFKSVWCGTSAWDQASADANIPHLLRTPAAVRWLSLEPLLGPVDILSSLTGRVHEQHGDEFFLPDMHFIVIGCESGPSRRPCELEWVRSVVEQCAAAGVKCFVKQLDLDGRVSHDPAEWPEDLRVREYPDA